MISLYIVRMLMTIHQLSILLHLIPSTSPILPVPSNYQTSIHPLSKERLTCAAHDFEAFANVLSGVKSLNVVFADILLGDVYYQLSNHQLIDIDGLNRDVGVGVG
jgi:hypothetical protein